MWAPAGAFSEPKIAPLGFSVPTIASFCVFNIEIRLGGSFPADFDSKRLVFTYLLRDEPARTAASCFPNSWDPCPDSWGLFPDSWELFPDSWELACGAKRQSLEALSWNNPREDEERKEHIPHA